MKALLPSGLLLLLGLLAPLTATPYTESLTGINFPDELSGMLLTKITDYEAQNPGGGTGISYRAPNAKADFYIYNGGLKNIPSNLDSPPISQHFQAVVDAIPKLLGQPENQLKILQPREEIRIGQLAFLHTALSYQLNDEGKITHVYLTSLNHQFLKIRFTCINSSLQVNDRILQDFLQGSAKLWPSP
ncbi:MAG: hypothetical protein LBH01_00235 [Verrucomicrobiales bacterium]|jgi:hypothetical protein|nr:hypothetical protein [Verrucomicrobiales bacterium]